VYFDQAKADFEAHALCYDCARDHVTTFASNGDPNAKCHMCDHSLSVDEIALVLGNGSIPQGQQDPLFEMIDILKRDFVVGRDPSKYAACPVGGCNYFVERSEVGATEEATCPRCDFTFCTNCVRLYHYRTSCAEARQLQDKWRTWTVSGRARYWQKDDEMRRMAEQMAKDEHNRVQAARQNERVDEQWKAQNCRHCPPTAIGWSTN